MRLWGRVMRGGLLVMAAALAVTAIAVPEIQPAALVIVVLMVAGAFVGVPLVVRFFGLFIPDEAVLERGIPGSARIESLHVTRWRFNRTDPIVRLGLTVEADGVYPVEITQVVPPEVLQRLAPGTVVSVRVDRGDPRNVVIDWREPIGASTQAAVRPGTARSAPRRAPWTFLGGGSLLVGLVFVALGCEERSYEARGHRVQGVVLEKRTVPELRERRGSSRSRQEVRYRFTTQEGRTLEGRHVPLPRTWRELEEGGPVVVEYLPDAPRTNRIAGERAPSRMSAAIGAVFIATGAGLLVVARCSRVARAGP